MEKNSLAKVYDENNLPKRVDKTLSWLTDSRNGWKEKCMETKLCLKRQTQEIKRVKESRDEWKLRNIRLKAELIECKEMSSSLQDRIKELESQIELRNTELNEIKKKP